MGKVLRTLRLLLALCVVLTAHVHAQDQVHMVDPDDAPVFKGGTAGYAAFRIPSLVTFKKAGHPRHGRVIAIAEGRVGDGPLDAGNIDIVYRTREVGSTTWGPLKVLWSKDLPAPADPSVSGNTCGNPTVVLQEIGAFPGRIWLMMNWQPGDRAQGSLAPGERKVYVTWSDDAGDTWQQPKHITPQVQYDSDDNWDAVGPGAGLQVRHGPHRGRLVFPAIGRNLYTDDCASPNGQALCNGGFGPGQRPRWNQGQYLVRPGTTQVETSESAVVELLTGELLRSDRAVSLPLKCDMRQHMIESQGYGTLWGASNEEYYQSRPELLAPGYVGGKYSVAFNAAPLANGVECKRYAPYCFTLPGAVASTCLNQTAVCRYQGRDYAPGSTLPNGVECLNPQCSDLPSDPSCLQGRCWLRNTERQDQLPSVVTGCPSHAYGVVRVHSSLLRYTETSPARLMFINPASTVERRYPTIHISYDEGKTWPISRRIVQGPGGYTAMTKTTDFQVGILIEEPETPSKPAHIYYHTVNLAWILNGRSEPAP